jgi:MarR family transcriptional regulator, organic hydroperoxide resistance regulator
MGSNTNPPEVVGRTLVSIRRLVRTLRTTAVSVERETGLSTAQTFVLQLLLEAPAESMNDLAERTSTDQSSVSVVVTRLEAKGLVARLASATDARRTQVVITDNGIALMQRKPPTVQERLTHALSNMPPKSLELLSSELNNLVALMGADDEPATLIFEDDATGSTLGS